MLSGKKVTSEIAQICGIPEGIASISQNQYPEVDSVADLLDLIARIREVTGKPVGFKCVIGDYGWLAFLFDEILSRGIESTPDFITINSADGGIGAAPMSLINYMVLPIWDSLTLVIDRLVAYELKNRIKIIASGKLITPADVP